jgi:hypothetical protein
MIKSVETVKRLWDILLSNNFENGAAIDYFD